jgi:two-component system, cell cycle response regulator
LTAPQILVADDNGDNLELMRYLLTAAGYLTVLAGGGAEAVRRAVDERPELILLDVQMPVVDGYRAAMAIRREPSFQRVKIVAVTASAMVGDRDQILAAGFDGYIAKPIAPTTFITQIERFVPSGRRARPQRPPEPA